MRALLKKALLLGVCSTAGSLGVSLMTPEPAQAFISPCMVLGSPMPPPCITFDYKRLADLATTNAQEVQKVAAKIEEVKSWADGQKIIGKMQEAVGIKDLAAPQLFNGLGQAFPDISETTSFLSAKGSTSKFFAESGSGTDEINKIQNERGTYARAANVEGMALAYRKGEMVEHTLSDADRIAKAAAASTDLRSDWAINSEARRAVAQAQATQNYLWQALLQQNSTSQMVGLPVDIGKVSLAPSASSAGSEVVADNGDWDRLQRLIALNAEAQNLLSRLGASKSADQVTTIVDMVKADYQDALNRQANLEARFPQKAREWACHADRCGSYMTIVNTSKSRISTWDSQMQALRGREISQLGSEFSKRQIDVQAMMSAEIDPRQFIGTWGDPAKYDDMMAIGRDLYKNALDKYIDGDSDNAEFQQMLYDYNDVRLEVAWKLEDYEEALKTEQELKQIKDEIQASAETKLTEDDVTKRLQEIASEGNELGQQLAASQDQNIVNAARDRLNELNATLGQGVKLPEQAEYSPETCQEAAAFVASQVDSNGKPMQMTAEEMAKCQQAITNPSDPYYVSR